MDEDIKTELDHLTVRSQRDLHRMWELLMEPLGFSGTSLWVTFIDADGRPLRHLLEIAESEVLPSPAEVANLYEVLELVCEDLPEGTSVAFLLSRPGREGVTAFDRDFASRLMAGARACRLAGHPTHRANDIGIVVLAPDDLAA